MKSNSQAIYALHTTYGWLCIVGCVVAFFVVHIELDNLKN